MKPEIPLPVCNSLSYSKQLRTRCILWGLSSQKCILIFTNSFPKKGCRGDISSSWYPEEVGYVIKSDDTNGIWGKLELLNK